MDITQLWNLSYNVGTEQLQSEKKKAHSFFSLLSKESGKKKFLGSSHRSVAPQKTLVLLNKKIKEIAGITRVSDITDLDIIGIPTYVAVRPEACLATPLQEGQISIYNGKGFTKIQAKASALMEAIERHAGEPFKRAPLIASYNQIKKLIDAVDPNSLNFLQLQDKLWQEAPIEWMVGSNLLTGKPIAVQAVNVFSPYISPPGTLTVNPQHSTTGLASGNTYIEATVHALFEVIERHGNTPNLPGVKIHSIPLEGISNKWVIQLLRKLHRQNIKVGLQYYKTPFEIPIVRASIDDPITRDPHLLCYGMGCHFSKDIALVRAITEAIQTRLTVISGTREDFHIMDDLRNDPRIYDKLCKKFESFFQLKDSISYDKLPHRENNSFREDLDHILKALKKNGYHQVIVVNLTRPEIGIPVVRVIVPSLPIQHHAINQLGKTAEDILNGI